MRALIKRTLGVDSDSRTAFEDMGVEGLDWDSFVEEYHKEFGVELKGLKYQDYFTEGVPIALSDIFLFPYRLTRLTILKLTGQSDKLNRRAILTTGDLILSVHAGQFVKRDDIEVRLLKTYGLQQKP
jgi:hypothetical protein